MIEDQDENSINDKENGFSCNICYVIFFSEKSLKKHEKSHQSKHSCKFCNQNFKSKSALFEHTGNLKHCENCEKKFICPGESWMHKLRKFHFDELVTLDFVTSIVNTVNHRIEVDL